MSLMEAVQCGEAMVAAGWRPHEAPQTWDRTELETCVQGLAAVDAATATRLEALSRRAAGVQTLPLRLQPAGGVRIGCPAVPQQPSPAPETWTKESDRAALYTAILADVAAGALERGEVKVMGRLFLGPKARPLQGFAFWAQIRLV